MNVTSAIFYSLVHCLIMLAIFLTPVILAWLGLDFLLWLFGIRKLRKVVAIAFGIVVFALVCYGPPQLWGDFTGMTEAETRHRLGEPFRDSRKEPPDANPQEYTLGWPYGL